MSIKSNINFTDAISYCIFPNSFIRNGQLDAHEKLLFSVLCTYDYLIDGVRKGWCDPSLETLSSDMGVSEQMISRHLAKLIKKGMVTVIYRNQSGNYERKKGDENVDDSVVLRHTSIYILNILPGVSEEDRNKLAASRDTEIKNQISGLNTLKVRTANGDVYVSESEFDLRYLVTGLRSNDIVEGELELPKEEQVVNTEKEESLDDDIFSFKKPDRPLPKEAEVKDQGNYDSKDPVERILAGNYKGIGTLELCTYFKFRYHVTYPTETITFSKAKASREMAVFKKLLEDMDASMLIPVIDFFIMNYAKLFANTDYPRPQMYQLGTTWIFNKTMEQMSLKYDPEINNNKVDSSKFEEMETYKL